MFSLRTAVALLSKPAGLSRAFSIAPRLSSLSSMRHFSSTRPKAAAAPEREEGAGRARSAGVSTRNNNREEQSEESSESSEDTSAEVEVGATEAPLRTGIPVEALDIPAEVTTRLHKAGITNLFPIQEATLRPLMEGRDMVGRARTGSGKTLAFVLPIANVIFPRSDGAYKPQLPVMSKHNVKPPRQAPGRPQIVPVSPMKPLVLILSPTRELATQTVDVITKTLGPNLVCNMVGGVSFTPQISKL